MDQQAKQQLAQSLLRDHALAHVGRVDTPVHDTHQLHPDVTPFALAACAANPYLHHHIDEALRCADPAWEARTMESPLLHHPALATLSPGDVPYAIRLLGIVLAAFHDPLARSCLDSLMRHGWHRVWQTVHTGEAFSIERFQAAHSSHRPQEPDGEVIILVWYAALCGVPVLETPARSALDASLVKAAHQLALEAAKMDPISRERYDALLRYGRAWQSARDGSNEDLARHLVMVHDALRSAVPETAQQMPDSAELWHLAFHLAQMDATLDDRRAVGILVILAALQNRVNTPVVSVTAIPDRRTPAPDNQRELKELQAALAAEERENHRLTGDLERTRQRLSVREAEISRLLGIVSLRESPEPEEQYSVRTLSQRVLVAGGHETLIRNLQTWLPNSICIATNGKEDLDPAVLGTTRLVVVLTSYISHSFSTKVVSEAHKRDIPVLLLDWRNAKHILQEIDLALQGPSSTV